MSSIDAKSQRKIFTGNANPKLAQAIAHYLQLPVGEGWSDALVMAKFGSKSAKMYVVPMYS